jgi:prenylcysteine oxidase/farnesylcysteine lyase
MRCCSLLLCFGAVAETAETETTDVDVVVIGGGIGAAAFSYYYSKLNNHSTAEPRKLLAFESRDYIGGRLKHMVIANTTVELGGDAWSTANRYVVELVKELGVNSSVSSRATTFGVGDPITANIGVWNGSGFLPIEKTIAGHSISDIAGAITETDFLGALRTNYHLRGPLENGMPFRTVADFLQSGSLDRYTPVTSASYLSEHKVASLTQYSLIEPLLRVIYDQGLEAHSFASLVALTSVVGAASVDEGNSVLVERLFAAAGGSAGYAPTKTSVDVLLNSSVRSVSATAGGGFAVEVEGGTETMKVVYTVQTKKIVIASPIEFINVSFTNVSGISGGPAVPITSSFVPPAQLQHRPFVKWFVTIVRASTIDPTYFGLRKNATVPANILTTRDCTSTTPFNVIQLEAALGKDDNLYKIFSNGDVRPLLAQIFTDITDVTVQAWPYTFPKLTPVNDSSFQPIILSEAGVYYLNTLESVASAMEGSIIAGRNVAQLMHANSNSESS